MSTRNVEKLNTSQRQKFTLDQSGNTESCKAQYISVIKRTPHMPIMSSQVEDEDVVIVAEYNRKSSIAEDTNSAENASNAVNEKESQEEKRLKSGNNDSGLLNNQFWYAECGPEMIDLDKSDTESEDEDSEGSSCDTVSSHSIQEEGILIPPRSVKSRFEILEETSYHIPGQKIWKREMGVRINEPIAGNDPSDWSELAFRDLFAHLTSSCEPTDNAGITLTVAGSAHAPVSLSCRRIRDFTHSDLCNLIGSANSSAAAFKLNDTFLLTICVINGIIARDLTSLDPAIVANKSILTIRSDDTLSLPRALVTARVYAQRGELRAGELHNLWERIRCRSSSRQQIEARELIQRAGIKIPEGGYGIRDVEGFQNYLATEGMAIMVFEISNLGRGGGPLFDGTAVVKNIGGRARHTLHLAYYERHRHYQPILNLPAAASSRGFCAPCNTSFYNETDHACANRCTQCFASPPCLFDSRERLKCDECNRCFFGSRCFERHKAERRHSDDSVCRTLCLCSTCWMTVKYAEKKEHVCKEAKQYLTRSRESSFVGSNMQFGIDV